jgi:RimJ/RimL family protein N-acetyltransferase
MLKRRRGLVISLTNADIALGCADGEVTRASKPTGVTIRAARADDRERLVRAFRELDKESIYRRFFFHKKALHDQELLRLTAADGGRDIVRVATVGTGSEETIVGLGHCVRSGSSADIAFVVAEDYHGRGIAAALLRQLIDIARRSGVTRFQADVLADNMAMLNVFRRSELPMHETRSGAVVHVNLFLDPGAADASVEPGRA